MTATTTRSSTSARWTRWILLIGYFTVGTIARDRFLRPVIGDYVARWCLWTGGLWILVGFVTPESLSRSSESARIPMSRNVSAVILGIAGILVGAAAAFIDVKVLSH